MDVPVPKFGSFRRKDDASSERRPSGTGTPRKRNRDEYEQRGSRRAVPVHSSDNHRQSINPSRDDSRSFRQQDSRHGSHNHHQRFGQHRHHRGDSASHQQQRHLPRHHQTQDQVYCASRSALPLSSSRVTAKPSHQVSHDSFKLHGFNDRKGDPGILQFGFTDRSKVPIYREPPPWLCLGLSEEDRRAHKWQDSVTSPLTQHKPSQARYHETVTQLGNDGENCEPLPQDADYISLGSTPAVNNAIAEASSEVQGSSAADSTLAHAGTADRVTDQHLVDEQPNQQTTLHRRYNEFQRTLKALPEDTTNWLEFCNFQQEWAENGLTAGGNKASVSRQVIAQLRSNVLHDALRAVTDPLGKEKILIALMENHSITLSGEEVDHQWQAYIQQNPDLLGLRRQYIDHLQSNSMNYQFEACQAQWLMLLQASKEPSNTLRSFHDYTVFLWDAGFRELSIAAWQMLIEVHFFKPDAVGGDAPQLKAAFEEYWDSESVRIGEQGSTGWCHTLNDGNVDLDQTGISNIELNQADSTQYLSGRTTDDDDNDDPYHVVFFSDLDALFDVTAASFDSMDVVNSFLAFNGLPLLLCASVELDAALQTSSVASTTQSKWRGFLSQPLMTRDSLVGGFAHTFSARAQSLESRAQFVVNVLQALLSKKSIAKGLREYFLALVAAISRYMTNVSGNDSTTGLLNHAMEILIQHSPDDARLSSSRILLSAVQNPSGQWEDDMASLISAKHQAHSNGDSEDWIALWRDWATTAMTLQNGHAEQILAGIMDGKVDTLSTPSYATLLKLGKTQEWLQQRYFEHYAASRTSKCLPYVDCLVLVDYLCDTRLATSDQVKRRTPSLPAAFQTYMRHLGALSGRIKDLELEEYHQNFAMLVSSHISRYNGAMAPTDRNDIIHYLRTSAALFGHNEAILQALSAMFSGSERIRTLLPSRSVPDALQEPQTRAAWACAIDKEMKLTANAGGNSISVRGTFEQAAEEPRCWRAVAFWMWWMSWELSIDSGPYEVKTGAVRARQVWHRAMQALPGNVHILMSGLAQFADEHEASQLRDLAQERGLRLSM